MIQQQELWSEKWQTGSPSDLPFEKLETELEEAIKLQLIGDVPIGVFLSGGCDSTLVSALAQKLNKSPIHSFSLGFENVAFDESNFALKAALQIGTNHHALTMSAQNAAEILPYVLKAYAEPLGDPSVLPTTFISREARKHVTVVLTGDGADELFFGYGRYSRYLELEKFEKTIPFANSFSSILRLIIKFSPRKLVGKLLRIASALSTDSKGQKYVSLIGFKHIAPFLDVDDFEKITQQSLQRLWNKGTAGLSINRLREIDSDSYLTDDILVKVDRAAMAFGLETRAPFLDQKVNHLSQIAPLAWLNSSEQKHAIKRVLEKHVSDDIFRRQKMGFGAPLQDWFKTSLNSWGQNLVENFKWDSINVDSRLVQDLWNKTLRTEEDFSTYLWMLFVLAAAIEKLK